MMDLQISSTYHRDSGLVQEPL